jgi:molybdopterin molybdotransferase
MEMEIQLVSHPVVEKICLPVQVGTGGAWVEFRGVVRDEENGQKISALEYEAYSEMARREIRRLLETISTRHPCLAARVIHRLGVVPVGETSIYLGIAAEHRAEAIALLAEFMDRLKQDVPIWKRRALPVVVADVSSQVSTFIPDPDSQKRQQKVLSLDEAITEIRARCQPMPAVCVPLDDAFGHVLRETVFAEEDLPSFDCSTRDGYAILSGDSSVSFQVVDTIRAADWKPHELKTGQAMRIATGAALPCGGLRVVMQEHVERDGDRIRIVKNERATHLRLRGEDVEAGQPLVPVDTRLNAGTLALLATAGCVQPLVSPPLCVIHFTTGDEIVSPGQPPKPGQIRDSNSILIRGLLRKFSCHLEQKHLPENFDAAWRELDLNRIAAADLVLVSGGASVGEKDFTRPLLERLGFEIIFSQVNLRPGRPLLFGVNGSRAAFGLPGNPLSHFACFHFAVVTALARLEGKAGPSFLRGRLATQLDDPPCPRETLWPAQLEFENGELRLRPLKWSSSGDVTCLAEANALVRVPANLGSLDAGVEVDFLPATDMMDA